MKQWSRGSAVVPNSDVLRLPAAAVALDIRQCDKRPHGTNVRHLLLLLLLFGHGVATPACLGARCLTFASHVCIVREFFVGWYQLNSLPLTVCGT